MKRVNSPPQLTSYDAPNNVLAFEQDEFIYTLQEQHLDASAQARSLSFEHLEDLLSVQLPVMSHDIRLSTYDFSYIPYSAIGVPVPKLRIETYDAWLMRLLLHHLTKLLKTLSTRAQMSKSPELPTSKIPHLLKMMHVSNANRYRYASLFPQYSS